jgi:capping protein alpha
MRGALQAAVSNYISTNYPSETSAGSVYTKDENTFIVAVSGEKTSLKNFWGGRWSSTWTLSVNGSSCTITGDIKVRGYHESFSAAWSYRAMMCLGRRL